MKCKLLLLFFCVGWVWAWGQPDKKARAKELSILGKYEEALALLTNAADLKRDEEAKFLTAICYFQLNRLNESAALLTTLVEEEKSPYPECWFFLGKIFHARHQFAEAATYYKTYLKNISEDHPARPFVWDAVKKCSNGLEWQFKPTLAYVENLGKNVNTKFDEFAPAMSPNFDDRLYFSSIREGNAGGRRNALGSPDERNGFFTADMFFCNNDKGKWGGVLPMPYQLNSPRHEVLLGFNKDGTALFYFKGLQPNKGQIVVDTFRKLEERLVSSDPFLGPIDPDAGDFAPYFANDTLIVFASKRPGGFGGLDIYKTVWRNGRWSAPENLGPRINSPYDETSPFFCRDGKTLYFSSNNSDHSIGGFDIFKSIFNAKAQEWTIPFNLGLPINSAGDEDYFRLSKDGFTGFFSSSRKDGFGMRDLYIAYFNDYLPEQELPEPLAATFHKPVREDKFQEESLDKQEREPQQQPSASEKIEEYAATQASTLFFDTESEVLSPKNKQTLDKIAGQIQPAQKVVITVYGLKNTPISNQLYEAIKCAEKAGNYLLQNEVSPDAIFMRGAIPAAPVNQPSGFAMTIDLSGDEQVASKGIQSSYYDDMLHKDLFYKVQIVSLKTVYKGALLLEYPHPMVEKIPTFEYYRYTVGAVATFAEAMQLREAVREKGIGSAFVVPYIFGVRADKAIARQFVKQLPDLQNFIK